MQTKHALLASHLSQLTIKRQNEIMDKAVQYIKTKGIKILWYDQLLRMIMDHAKSNITRELEVYAPENNELVELYCFLAQQLLIQDGFKAIRNKPDYIKTG